MSRLYRNKQEYINTLNELLEAREDFKELTYHKHPTTQEEYLFMTLITGEVFMFEITGYKNEQIFHKMAEIECGVSPDNLITDKDKRLELGKLFN